MEAVRSFGSPTQYRKIEHLGTGGQGVVYKVQWCSSGKVYALKEMLPKVTYAKINGTPSEILILKDVVQRHRNIIEL